MTYQIQYYKNQLNKHINDNNNERIKILMRVIIMMKVVPIGVGGYYLFVQFQVYFIIISDFRKC